MYHLTSEVWVCSFIKLSIVKLSLSFIDIWLFIQDDYCTSLVSWFDNYIYIFIQRPYCFIFFFCGIREKKKAPKDKQTKLKIIRNLLYIDGEKLTDPIMLP